VNENDMRKKRGGYNKSKNKGGEERQRQKRQRIGAGRPYQLPSHFQK